MSSRLTRTFIALLLAFAAGGIGYTAHDSSAAQAIEVSAPPSGSVRVIYSLDAKRNDQEIIALVNAAKDHIYFAMYEFTLDDVADALVAAKQRGVEVKGLVDAGESANSYDAPIMEKLKAAGIPIETEKHADQNGIMHIKAIVTDQAYALGSYNWTSSATHENDELLEIGTDPTLRQTYEDILVRLLDKYQGSAVSQKATKTGGMYDYTEADKHIGEYASVRGTPLKIYTSKSGTVFFDYCTNYKSCPFSVVIFASDAKKFGDLTQYQNTRITVTGKITSYQSHAEIVLSSQTQISE